MTTVESQGILGFPQAMPASVAMDIEAAELEQERDCHSSSGSSYSCRAQVSGACIARPELEEVSHALQGESEVSLLQLQASTSAATGESGEESREEGEEAGSAGSAEQWPQDGAARERLGQEESIEEDELGIALASEAAEGGGSGGELPFSKQLISFSLFGKLPPKSSKSASQYIGWQQVLMVSLAWSRTSVDRIFECQDC